MNTNLTANRTAHSRGVALYMRENAPKLGLEPDEAALCGWLHDFGYIAGDNRSHARIGGRLLREQGYRHWREVSTHGSVDGLFSPLGVLLNIADMSVDSKGEVVGFATRLEDVAERYGKDSVQYKDCLAVINAIKSTSEWSALNGN